MGKTLLRFSENSFAVFVLLLSTSPLLQILKSGASENPNSSEGYPLLQTLWFCIYLVVVFLLCLRWKRFIYTALKNKYLLLLISVPLLSVVWSIAPLITLRRSVGLVGTTLFGIYLTSRYSLKEQLRLLAWALGIATVFSIIFVVALPNYGINWHQNGSWQGIYHQKNILGRHMSLAAIAYLLLALDARRSRWLPWTLFFLSTTLLLLSTSKTALVAFLSVAILLPLYRALRFPFNIRVPFLSLRF